MASPSESFISRPFDASDLPADVLQGFLDTVAAGEATVPISHVYDFDQIMQAHADMEAGTATGKLVVTTPRTTR